MKFMSVRIPVSWVKMRILCLLACTAVSRQPWRQGLMTTLSADVGSVLSFPAGIFSLSDPGHQPWLAWAGVSETTVAW